MTDVGEPNGLSAAKCVADFYALWCDECGAHPSKCRRKSSSTDSLHTSGWRMTVTIRHGDCLDVLRTLPDQSAHCCVSSPPYWRQRDYGMLPAARLWRCLRRSVSDAQRV